MGRHLWPYECLDCACNAMQCHAMSCNDMHVCAWRRALSSPCPFTFERRSCVAQDLREILMIGRMEETAPPT